MKNISKKLLAVILSVMMLFSLIPAQTFTASAEETYDPNTIYDYETFIGYLGFLEEAAYAYMYEVDSSVDPLSLVIKYIRTGVDRYNSGSWGIMAGYEDENFAAFIEMIQEANNEGIPDEEKLYVTSLKNIENFYLPNGDYVDIGHMFGTMDITYTNKTSINHADVGGWAGDLVDLLSAADALGVEGTVDEMVDTIAKDVLGIDFGGEIESFSNTDIIGDLDAFYIMNELDTENYYYGDLTNLMLLYFTEDLSMEDRAEYFIKNRLDGVTLRDSLRETVLNTYIDNKVVSTLEGTRDFTSTNLNDLRKACCYTFADYICKLAGDYVETPENSYFDVFSSTTSTLAPGITQDIRQATTIDGKQMVYYIATADLNRDDVNVYANYNNNDPAAGWAMQRVIEQANAAQAKYGDPASEQYIENYNVIAATNGAGFNMGTGEPGGLLVMGGVEYHSINSNGFFGILKDGTPIIASTDDYNNKYKGQVAEGIAGFGATLIKDGKIVVTASDTYTSNRASRTAVGITKTGKVVLMVLDGRQEPFSCGGSYQEIAQVMLEAGCYNAVNLDGGGSSTFVAKQEGDDELSVVNRPSDGYDRSVSTSLMIVSTAPSSTAFDHAVIESNYDYLTPNSSVELSVFGVSATGNSADLPEGTSFAVSDANIGTISEDGIFTAKAYGDVEIRLMLGEEVLATKTLSVVVPQAVAFTKTALNAVYGSKLALPLKATYLGKTVVINSNDVELSMNNTAAGTFEGLYFIGKESSGVKVVTLSVKVKGSEDAATSTLQVSLFNQGEAAFDFDQATAGDRQLAWDRKVTNSTTDDAITYNVIDPDKDMVTSYIFAIDMSKIEIPEHLNDLVYMLPGSDVEGANAWTFLCQLAQRVSDLTTVTPVIKFDENFDVDYSNITLVNDYFTLTDKSFNEETNELTITLKWIKQTQAIDVTMANPICIVSGVKLTPKDNAAWDSQGKLNVVNSGSIGYTIYLRANALYSFALKEENQATYGLYPFVNPDDDGEAGAYLNSVYKEFEDTYTLNKALKNGWVTVKGGAEYYVDGVKTTGIALVDGYYYDFGEDGVCIGQTKYTGIFFDEEASAYRYSKLGEIQKGWHMIANEWYYFRYTTLAAQPGYYTVDGIEYHFEQNGKLTTGVWKETENGWRYYYGPGYYGKGWAEIDGNTYFFDDNACRVVGIFIFRPYFAVNPIWYEFTDEGVLLGQLTHTGFYVYQDNTYYLTNGVGALGLTIIDGEYYYFHTTTGKMAIDEYAFTYETNGLLEEGEYYFDSSGKMTEPKNGIVAENGGLYYYINGKLQKGAGMIKIDDSYYFVRSNGALATGSYNTYNNNGLMEEGVYYFDLETGKLTPPKNGIVAENGGLYYYINGELQKSAGMIKIDDSYYFVRSNGSLATGSYNTYNNNGLMEEGVYYFDLETGKLILPKKEIIAENGSLYYYRDGELKKAAGMIKIDDNFYFVRTNGSLATGIYDTYNNNGLMEEGVYYFDLETGKLQMGIGVTKVDDSYYFVGIDGTLTKCQVITNPTCDENGLLTYTSDAGESITETIPAIGHNYNAVVTAPTCTIEGYTTHTCENCGDINITDIIGPAGHTPGASANCTEDQICTVCKNILEESHGHNFSSEWTIETLPTYSEDGCKYHICLNSNCNEKSEVTVLEKHTIPDINSDGVLSADDLVLLRRIILGIDFVETDADMDIYETVMDLNDDGKYNIIDLISLKKMMLEFS